MDSETLRRAIVEVLPRLRRFAYVVTGSHADADDLLQATVERVLARGAPHDANIQKWSFHICKNIHIDQIRAKKVRTDAIANGKIESDSSVDGERIIMGEISFGKVKEAMAELPIDQRAVLALVAIEGYSYAEAAATLEVPVGTVMSRMARARKTLTKIMTTRNSDNKQKTGEQLP